MDYKELKYLQNNILNERGCEPKKELMFKVFETHPEDIKVIILGHCPYPNLGMATGLAFENGWKDTNDILTTGVRKNEVTPMELQIIEKGVKMDYDYKGIENWTQQGVFLLNTALTVERGKPDSHNQYWKQFTNRVINHISSYKGNKVWLIWGTKMKEFIPQISNVFHVNGYDRENIDKIPVYMDKNYVITGGKPITEYYSESGSNFYNRNFFLFTNRILQKSGYSKIKW